MPRFVLAAKNQRGFRTRTARLTSPPLPMVDGHGPQLGKEERKARNGGGLQLTETNSDSREISVLRCHLTLCAMVRRLHADVTQHVESAVRRGERVVADCLGLCRMSVLVGFRANQASLGMHIDCITLQLERQRARK